MKMDREKATVQQEHGIQIAALFLCSILPMRLPG